MDAVNLIGLAVALAMDAFAVAVAAGVTLRSVTLRQTFRLAWHFGLFQAVMPIIGWLAGLTIQEYIEAYDHWLAFGLLTVIGGKMIWESRSSGEKSEDVCDPTKGASLIILSTAVSIDALAVGLSMAMLKISVWTPAAVIGIIAGLFTIAGLNIGKLAGSSDSLSRYAELIGGLVLICIGLNILREHGVLGCLA